MVEGRHQHTGDCDCFSCKLAYWRQRGMNVSIPQDWNNRPTVREIEREFIDDARATGRDFELADDKYRWL